MYTVACLRFLGEGEKGIGRVLTEGDALLFARGCRSRLDPDEIGDGGDDCNYDR